jgi:hypothetical protein
MAKSFSFEGHERVAKDCVSKIGLTDTSQPNTSLDNRADVADCHLTVTSLGNP